MQTIEEFVPQKTTEIRSKMREKRPFIVRNWSGLSQTKDWSFEEITEACGETEARVSANKTARSLATHEKPLPFTQMNARDFFEKVFVEKDSQFKNYYLMESVLKFPKLVECIDYYSIMSKEELLYALFWASSSGVYSPLHYDPYENFFLQIKGAKKFILFKPGLSGFYPYPFWGEASYASRVDIENFDASQFGKFNKEDAIEVVLNGGDCLYLPGYWWHQVHSLGELNLSLSLWEDCSTACKVKNWQKHMRLMPLQLRRKLVGRLARVRATS